MMRKMSFSMEELSNFIIEECASLRKISLRVEIDIGYCTVKTAFIKCGLKIASMRSPIIFTAE
jgi:hypothetical protein